MPELDDHKTDSLFQVGAGRHDFEYEPAAWEQMEVLLNADEAARRRRILWFLGIAVVLLISLLFFGYQYGEPEETKADPILTEQDIAPGITPAEAASTSVEESTKDEVITSDVSGINKSISESIENTSDTTTSTNDGVNNQKEGVSSSAPQTSVKENTSGTKPRSSGIGVESIQSDQLSKVDHELPIESTLPSVEKLKGKDGSASQQRTAKSTPPLPLQPILLLTYEEELPEIGVLPVKRAETLEVKPPWISLGVSAGLVFGSVESSGFGTTRSRFGAKIDYRLGKKFSLGTGAYLNKVYYKADGEDYKAEENIWTDGIEPESILADCNVLEIPLSLTYFPRGSNKSGLYAATGLTSYFMMKEVFTFNYDSPRDDLIKGWKEENTNKHLLGLGHFNLGYQRKNGKRSAFQIESFIHLPLQGIGHGKVNLITAGASVNYTFGLKRKE